MKSNAIIRIILFSLAILVLGSILCVALLGDVFMFRTESHHGDLPLASDSSTTQSAIGASDVLNIDIDWATGSITIQPAENTDLITVQETGDKNRPMRLRLENHTLEIDFTEDEKIGIGLNDYKSKDLVITVPVGWICASLDIDAASAKVSVQDMTIDNVDFDGASGDCIFTNCTVGQYEVDTASGNIHYSGHVDHFECDAVSADCTLELCNNPSSIRVDSLSGDLELTLPQDCGFSCDVGTMSGSFHTDFDCSQNGKIHTYGDGSCQIQLNALSGNVNIQKHHDAESGKNHHH